MPNCLNMTTNYFKAEGRVFLFDHKVPESISEAFAKAQAVGKVSVFKPLDGFDVPIIGHRPRKDILRDLGRETDAKRQANLHEELACLQNEYRA
jgi:hypothetical protein